MKILMLISVFLVLTNTVYCAPKASCKTYTLQPGDSCYGLGINQAANPSINCNFLIAYTQICIYYSTQTVTSCGSNSNIYTIKSGDSCYSLGLSMADAKSQGLNCNSLQIGQTVCLNSNQVTQPSVTSCSSGYSLYSVQSGDTCYNLGLSSSDIQNQGLNCKFLQVGQTLCLPNNKPTVSNQVTTPVPVSCNSASNQYVIQSGDTCFGLGISSSEAAYQRINCNNLQIGQIVCRPNIVAITTRQTWNNCRICLVLEKKLGLKI